MFKSILSVDSIAIPETLKTEYVNEYINFLQSSPAPSASQIYTQLFKMETPSEVNGLQGFSLSVKDYIELFSRPGITSWDMFFGFKKGIKILDDEPDGFRIMMRGTGPGGMETGYFLLPNPLLGSVTKPHIQSDFFQVMERPINNKVPVIMLNEWVKAWGNLVGTAAAPNQAVPIDVMQLRINPQSNPQTVLGYQFSVNDFLDVLTNPNRELTLDSEIRFYLVNETIAQEDQANKSGYLGVIMVAVDENKQVVSASYNFSAPCPPTCPR